MSSSPCPPGSTSAVDGTDGGATGANRRTSMGPATVPPPPVVDVDVDDVALQPGISRANAAVVGVSPDDRSPITQYGRMVATTMLPMLRPVTLPKLLPSAVDTICIDTGGLVVLVLSRDT